MFRPIAVKFYGQGEMGEVAMKALKRLEEQGKIAFDEEHFDVLFSASYPTRITQEECQKASIAAVNIHTGLLPEGRGSNPLNWAIIWGKAKTGVTIHKIAESYDSGDIFLQTEIPIGKDDFVMDVRKKCIQEYPRIITAFFDDLSIIKKPKKQNQANASYAQKRYPCDSELNLDAKPHEIYNLFRACDPEKYPAFVMINGEKRIVKSVTPVGGIKYL